MKTCSISLVRKYFLWIDTYLNLCTYSGQQKLHVFPLTLQTLIFSTCMYPKVFIAIFRKVFMLVRFLSYIKKSFPFLPTLFFFKNVYGNTDIYFYSTLHDVSFSFCIYHLHVLKSQELFFLEKMCFFIYI
jgi:hypothetical protein